jgi:hypothetical protein
MQLQFNFTFLGLLTLIFIIFKLCHAITCSWWLVLLPAYILPLAWILTLLVIATFACFAPIVLGVIEGISKKTL